MKEIQTKHAKLSYREATDLIKNHFKNAGHGKIAEFCRKNEHIPYPTLNAFINDNELNYKPQKLVKDCLEALGYGNFKIEKEITFVNDGEKNS